jgi:glycosyltransferase involved in cell wall biosynthesis
LRIVQLVENLEVGGLESLAVDLALAQQRAGHEVRMYCLFGAGPLAGKLESAGIPVVTLQKPPGFSLATLLAMARCLRRDRTEVIHGHNPGVHHYAAIAARLAGVPVCVNTRHSAATSTGAPYQERYFRWVQPLTGQVVFVCDAVRAPLVPRLRYPAEKCGVILNGIPLDPFRGRHASPGAHLPRIRFGTIGRLVPAKAHGILIDAFARIAPRLPEATLHIYGYGALEADLTAQIVRLGLEQRVWLEGRTSDPAGALETLDVFVFSSIHEGLPLVVLEAMAAGLPIVSAAVGGVPEILPESIGWLCPTGDAGALAEAMLTAATAPDLQLRGSAAREIALANHGIDSMSRNYEALYQRLLQNTTLPASVRRCTKDL